MMTNPFQKEGNDEKQDWKQKKELRRLSSKRELIVVCSSFLSSFINMVHNSINFILGLYFGHFLGSVLG